MIEVAPAALCSDNREAHWSIAVVSLSGHMVLACVALWASGSFCVALGPERHRERHEATEGDEAAIKAASLFEPNEAKRSPQRFRGSGEGQWSLSCWLTGWLALLLVWVLLAD